MKYSVVTFGCRVNQADSLGFEEALQAEGHQSGVAEEADLVIVNSCSVTCSADQGTRQAIRRIAKTNSNARILVTGCYATRRPEEVATLPNVIRVMPNGEKAAARDVFSELGWSTAERFGTGEGGCGAPIGPGLAGRTSYTLRVQTGCAEACTYCIIPATRGAPTSATPDTVLREIRRVAAAGFREVVLTGVHLGSYGRDLVPRSSLSALLQAIADAAIPDVRYRVSSLEPMDCTPEIVDLLAAGPPFAPHLHLPLQHASDRMLRAMGRPYTHAQYEALVAGIRDRLPNASIGTDLIVGFPGEREEDFDVLARYLARSPLTHAHVFPYSDRPGTVAAAMERHAVEGLTIRDRSRVLRDIATRLSKTFRARQVGTLHRALSIDDGTVAVTGNYLKVQIPGGHERNQWLTVRVTGAGEPIQGVVV